MLHHQKLANYVRKNTLFAILAITLILWLFNFSMSFLGELSKIKDGYSIWQAVSFIFWRSPKLLIEYLPMAALIGAVVGLGNLASHSEITVMRAAGISIFRIVFWVLQSVSVLIIIAWLLNQYVLPYSSLKAKVIKNPTSSELTNEMTGYWQYFNKNDIQLVTNQQSATKKTNTQINNHVLYIDYANANGVINDLTLWSIDKDSKVRSVFTAKSGKYQQDSQWLLYQVSTIDIAENGESHQSKSDSLLQTLPIKPKYIYIMTQYFKNLSITDLYMYNKYLNNGDVSSRKYELAFWEKVLSPLSFLALAMIACSFVFGSARQQSIGSRIVIAIFCGILFKYLQNLTNYIAIASTWPVVFFVFIPILVSFIIGLVLLHKRG